MKSSFIRWLLLFFLTLIIFFLSSTPNIFDNLPPVWYRGIIPGIPDDLKPFEIVGALLHFAEYLALSLLASWAIIGNKKEKKPLMVFVFVLSLVFAIYDENYQNRIPGRGSQFSDLLFDTLGIITGLFFYLRMRKWLNAKKQ